MNRFHIELQYVSESVTLLNMAAHQEQYITDYMYQLAARYGMTPDDRAKKVVDLLQEIEDVARAEFSKDMQTLRFYCEMEEDIGKADSFANILLLAGKTYNNDRSVAEHETYLNELSDQEYNAAFYDLVKAYGATTVDDGDDDKNTVTDVMDIIFQMEISDSRKLCLQQLFLHRKEHIKKLIALMLRAEKILKKYEKKLMVFGNELVDYVEGELQGRSLSDFILKEFYGNMSIPTDNRDCEIYLSYLKSAYMGFYLKGDEIESAEHVAVVGVIFSKGMSFRNLLEQRAQLSEDKVMTMLKLLADKSKLQILTATVDEPAYGSQLASMLGLTTATISHHTSALLEQDLLTLDKVDTKIYYRANPVMIRALIQYLQETLLHE
ncbi:DNA-binding transcriptional regulator, ArsR family [Pseudobutyrivibrio sp. UC1225]|uniref:ArsR/SmtB family transcription factor n=1 Tax=Pseudobutyrivibrio sp. UC1225 TaxID=1798185 RepID=UPI0008E87CB8|nr:ArsR family transcriptional regulator [Pseudobutyrivibrio sp. UC1225]SFO32241.1 DNA-binding transcriptional regulator, ArsR family [Pseudobutyrivibrio sp. UC1225]